VRKKVSIATIAEKTGVSKTTVSFVLNGKGDTNNISEETQKKILATAKELNYQPNLIARSLISGKSNSIGFIVPDISNPFFAKIGMYVEQFAYKKGYSVMFANTLEDPKQEQNVVDTFISRNIDGIIIAPTIKNDKLIEYLTDQSYPAIFFDRIEKAQTTSFVNINNKDSAQKLTESLINKGHRRIGLVSLTSYLPNLKERIEGYKKALKKNQIDIDEALVFDMEYSKKREGVKAALESMFSNATPVTAIVFLNNMLAAEGIWNINTHFKDRTNQVALACFDNLEFFDYSNPAITSVNQPRKEIAGKCVDMLTDLIENQTIHKGKTIKTNLIER
jgi:LacI family transcriptional regulator